MTIERAVAAPGSADDVLAHAVANRSVTFGAMVWRAWVKAVSLIGRWDMRVIVGALMLFLVGSAPAAAAGCNWPVSFSAVGQSKTQSLVACDFWYDGGYGGVFDSLGIEAAFEFGIGTNHKGGGAPVTEPRTGVNGGKYNLTFDITSGVMTIELVTPPTSRS